MPPSFDIPRLYLIYPPMARKVINRKVLRDEADAADKLKADAGGEGGEESGKKVKKKAAKRKSRTKTPEIVRKKVYWGVFNQSMKQVAKFDFAFKKSADNKAAELSANGKPLHFVQKVKEDITE